MTVWKLIIELFKLPMDAEVYYEDSEYGDMPIQALHVERDGRALVGERTQENYDRDQEQMDRWRTEREERERQAALHRAKVDAYQAAHPRGFHVATEDIKRRMRDEENNRSEK